jgi:hypothetical protein
MLFVLQSDLCANASRCVVVHESSGVTWVQVAQLVLLALAGGVAIWSLWLNSRAAQVQAFTKAADYLIEPEVMAGREWILENYGPQEHRRIPATGLTVRERRRLMRVLRAFDRTAAMANKRMLSRRMVVKVWQHTMTKIWYTSYEFIKAERERRGPFVPDFDEFVGRLKRHHKGWHPPDSA